MRKKSIRIIAFVVCALILCGCRKAPDKDVVTSKNNGVLQEKIYETESSEAVQGIGPSKIQWNEEFTSTDGSVSFSVNIDNEVSPDVKQVVEVVPHMLTEEDIQRVATVLLGDVNFYERRTSSNPVYSKSQYQEMINRLSAYASQDSLAELMGDSDAEVYLEFVHDYIEYWTKGYETASDEDPRTPCDWTLKKERYYNDDPIEIGSRTLAEDDDVLYANAQKNDIEYIYSVTRRTDRNPKLNQISLQLSEGLGLMPVDTAIYRSILCRTEKPTEEQVEAVRQKAQEMLNEMELGQWQITECSAKTYYIGIGADDPVEYTIHVEAEPKLNGISTIEGQSSEKLQDAYAPTYLMTETTFEFSANGDIIYFVLNSPLDVLEVPNENVKTISVAELTDKCKQQLTLSDADAYGLPSDVRKEIEDAQGEKLLCQVDISEAEYGFGRVKVPDTDDNYYYIPVLAFRGVVNYVTDQTGSVYYSNGTGESDEKLPILICINAIDGSIIQ